MNDTFKQKESQHINICAYFITAAITECFVFQQQIQDGVLTPLSDFCPVASSSGETPSVSMAVQSLLVLNVSYEWNGHTAVALE